MKKLLNPVLYAEEIDGNVSIAYTLLTGEQKDELYRKEKEEQERPQGQDLSGSVAFRMLNEN
jgi:hypothetical protein